MLGLQQSTLFGDWKMPHSCKTWETSAAGTLCSGAGVAGEVVWIEAAFLSSSSGAGDSGHWLRLLKD